MIRDVRTGMRDYFLYLIAAAGVAVLYTCASQQLFGIGFPLDDAWIHQTYARNLVLIGDWVYRAGVPSGGSTAPLWTAILALGYLLKIPALLWSAIIGVCLLAGIALLLQIWLKMQGLEISWCRALPLLVVFEWHLVWSALSGMETLAVTLIIVLVFCLQEMHDVPLFWLGVVTGLAVCLRPDAVTLMGPVAWMWFFRSREKELAFWPGMIRVGAGLLLILVPYLIFNRLVAGSWWPNTFYAKQTEYAVMRQAALTKRLLIILQPFVGLNSVLLAGFLYYVITIFKARKWLALAPGIWASGYLIIFAWRLPVVYQHGRYAMPTIPVFLMLGIIGWKKISDLPQTAWAGRVISRGWIVAVSVLSIAFLFIGGHAFAVDVAIIETEMVATAKWLEANTIETDLIAAHDIGALGYFSKRDILDLAGLISPEVIPIMRDENALAGFLEENGADYLMTFPGWYPELVGNATERVYLSDAQFSIIAGGENMTVYRWGTD